MRIISKQLGCVGTNTAKFLDWCSTKSSCAGCLMGFLHSVLSYKEIRGGVVIILENEERLNDKHVLHRK